MHETRTKCTIKLMEYLMAIDKLSYLNVQA